MLTLPDEGTVVVRQALRLSELVHGSSDRLGGDGNRGRSVALAHSNFLGPVDTVEHEVAVVLEALGSSFDDDEAEPRVVADDSREVVVDGVLLDLVLVRRVGEVANPVTTKEVSG